MKSKWLNCIVKYIETGDAGACPVCGSTCVTVDVIKWCDGKRTSWTMICKSCGKGEHFDGGSAAVTDDIGNR